MADNGTLHNPKLYRSYADAKATDFECALYECKNAEDIPGYIKQITSQVTLECYYRPGNEKHVYVETGDWDRILAEFVGMIIITIIGGLFDLVVAIPFLGLIVMICKWCIFDPLLERLSCRKCRKSPSAPRPVLDLPHSLETNNLYLVKQFTKYSAQKINKKIHYKLQWTYPLHIAAEKGHLEIAEYLLSAGANISTNTRNDMTPLHLACKNGEVDMMNLLIKHGCLGIYNSNHSDEPIIIKLLEKGYLDSAKLLLDAGYPLHKLAIQITNALPRIHNAAALSFIMNELEKPASLQSICRTTIRTSLGKNKIQGKLGQLSISNGGMLPEIIVKFLKLESMQTVFSLESEQ